MNWISVEDRLPDTYIDVLIYTNRNGRNFDIGHLGLNGHWYVHDNGYRLEADVLYWAKLEKPTR